jgi:hypothetical protein
MLPTILSYATSSPAWAIPPTARRASRGRGGTMIIGEIGLARALVDSVTISMWRGVMP